MVQTPQQRRANERFAKKEESKMGSFRTPKADKDTRRKTELSKQFRGSPVSRWIVYGFLFLLAGGILLEILRLFF